MINTKWSYQMPDLVEYLKTEFKQTIKDEDMPRFISSIWEWARKTNLNILNITVAPGFNGGFGYLITYEEQ